jgi:hypothetical protein
VSEISETEQATNENTAINSGLLRRLIYLGGLRRVTVVKEDNVSAPLKGMKGRRGRFTRKAVDYGGVSVPTLVLQLVDDDVSFGRDLERRMSQIL